jgi:hypothetical protein
MLVRRASLSRFAKQGPCHTIVLANCGFGRTRREARATKVGRARLACLMLIPQQPASSSSRSARVRSRPSTARAHMRCALRHDRHALDCDSCGAWALCRPRGCQRSNPAMADSKHGALAKARTRDSQIQDCDGCPGGGRTAKSDGRAAVLRTDVPSTRPLSRLRSATRKLWYPPRDLSPAVSTGEPRLVVVAPRLRRDSVATGVVAGARITSTDM